MKVGFIEAGNMGSALAKAAAKAENVNLYIYDKDEEKANAVASELGAQFMTDKAIALVCDYIFIGVKPNVVFSAAEGINRELRERAEPPVIVSMAAGTSLKTLEEAFDIKRLPIIRIMPNTPAAYGRGMMLWCENQYVTDNAAAEFEKIMQKSGELDNIPERLIDAASALSGCGPAFVYMFIEALADGAVECGLSRESALRYASETLIGAAETVKKSGKHPEALKDAVCSPGGSTIAGVHALEEGAFRATAANAVISAYKKTLTLGK